MLLLLLLQQQQPQTLSLPFSHKSHYLETN
jgi:hypothetical protein